MYVCMYACIYLCMYGPIMYVNQLQVMAPHLYFSINQLKELICYFPPDGSCGFLRIQVS